MNIVLHILIYIGALLLGAFLCWVFYQSFTFIQLRLLKKKLPKLLDEMEVRPPINKNIKEAEEYEREQFGKAREFDRLRRYAEVSSKKQGVGRREWDLESDEELRTRGSVPLRFPSLPKGDGESIKDYVGTTRVEPKRPENNRRVDF